MAEAVIAMQTALELGAGSSLDCASGQPLTDPLTEIWVPSGDTVSPRFYDVTATFVFGPPQ